MELVYNEQTGCWEQRKEPYAMIEIATEEEYNYLQKALEFYDKYKDVIKHD